MYMLRLFDETDLAQPLDARLLREGRLQMGRDPAADWTLADPDREISRTHCVLEAGGDGLTLCSTGTNGVFDEETGTRLPDEVAFPIEVPRTLRIGRYRLLIAAAPHDAIGGGSESRTMVMTPPLGESTRVPSDWSDAPSAARCFQEGSLLEAFCEGAGLDASLLSSEEPTEIMRRAGAVYRQMVLGIGDLMSERDQARAQYHLCRTTISGAGNNPFKWAPTQRLAVDLLLASNKGFLSGPAALRASLQDIKRHLVATFAGLHASLRAAVDMFEPARIDETVADRTSLFKSRTALQWQEVEARHQELRRQLDGGASGSLDQAFAGGYEMAERRNGETEA